MVRSSTGSDRPFRKPTGFQILPETLLFLQPLDDFEMSIFVGHMYGDFEFCLYGVLVQPPLYL